MWSSTTALFDCAVVCLVFSYMPCLDLFVVLVPYKLNSRGDGSFFGVEH